MPSIKPTQKERDDLVAFTVDLIGKGLSAGKVRQELVKKKKMVRRTADRYLSRARAEILAASNRETRDMRAEALAFLESVRGDPKATPRERLLAQQQITELMGLSLGNRQAGVNVNVGGDVSVELPVHQMREELLRDEGYLDYQRARIEAKSTILSICEPRPDSVDGDASTVRVEGVGRTVEDGPAPLRA